MKVNENGNKWCRAYGARRRWAKINATWKKKGSVSTVGALHK